MALQPTFEDVLHLVMWNGYADVAWPAVETSKATWEDERIWFPFLINMRYGKAKKVRVQIIAEHCLNMKKGEHRIVRPCECVNKHKPIFYRGSDFFLKRMGELGEHGKNTFLSKLFLAELHTYDTDCNNALLVSLENDTTPITNYLLINHPPENYTYKRKSCESITSKPITVKPKKDRSGFYFDRNSRTDRIMHYWSDRAFEIPIFNYFHNYDDAMINLELDNVENITQETKIKAAMMEQRKRERAVKTEKVKNTLYKQQFGGRR